MIPRVAITGIGVANPIGVGFAEFSDAVTQGISGLGPWSALDEARLVGELVDFKTSDYFIAEKSYLDPATELALAAAKLALDHAGLTAMPAARDRSGIVLNTDGCHDTLTTYRARAQKRGVRLATPLMFSESLINVPASVVSIDFHLEGYHATTCGDGADALATAIVGLAAGHVDAVLAGAATALPRGEAAKLAPTLLASDDPDDYDPLAGDAFVPGEGACLLLLETEAAATARGAEVYGWLTLGEPTGSASTFMTPEVDAPADELSSAPCALYGDGPAAQVFDAAAAVACLQAGMQPPLRGGAEGLDDRREPRAWAATEVVLATASGPAVVISGV